jgi:hypothetical protein
VGIKKGDDLDCWSPNQPHPLLPPTAASRHSHPPGRDRRGRARVLVRPNRQPLSPIDASGKCQPSPASRRPHKSGRGADSCLSSTQAATDDLDLTPPGPAAVVLVPKRRDADKDRPPRPSGGIVGRPTHPPAKIVQGAHKVFDRIPMR